MVIEVSLDQNSRDFVAILRFFNSLCLLKVLLFELVLGAMINLQRVNLPKSQHKHKMKKSYGWCFRQVGLLEVGHLVYLGFHHLLDSYLPTPSMSKIDFGAIPVLFKRTSG